MKTKNLTLREILTLKNSDQESNALQNEKIDRLVEAAQIKWDREILNTKERLNAAQEKLSDALSKERLEPVEVVSCYQAVTDEEYTLSVYEKMKATLFSFK
jgi:DNA-binding transcriptional regulator GbsR (MarR family)